MRDTSGLLYLVVIVIIAAQEFPVTIIELGISKRQKLPKGAAYFEPPTGTKIHLVAVAVPFTDIVFEICQKHQTDG